MSKKTQTFQNSQTQNNETLKLKNSPPPLSRAEIKKTAKQIWDGEIFVNQKRCKIFCFKIDGLWTAIRGRTERKAPTLKDAKKALKTALQGSQGNKKGHSGGTGTGG